MKIYRIYSLEDKVHLVKNILDHGFLTFVQGVAAGGDHLGRCCPEDCPAPEDSKNPS